MGGIFASDRLTHFAHGRLEANVVILGHGEDAVALVSVDTLFVGKELAGRICDTIGRRFGVPAEQILALATHTHFAPMVDPSKPSLGEASVLEIDRVGNLIETALGAARSREVGLVRVGHGSSDCAVNRRRRWRWPTVVRVLGKARGEFYNDDNPLGPRDPRIRTCVWMSSEGSPVAAFWSFACHPVAFPEPETASADYIGVVREAFRRRLGGDIPVIFAPGCMGDVRPRSPRPKNNPFKRALRLALFGQLATPFDRASWDAWAEGLADEVMAIDEAASMTPVQARHPAARMAGVPIDEIFEGTSPVPELHGKAVNVPGVGRIIALSCEPVTAIAGLVAESDDDLVLGYEGDVFGYLPTDAMVAEGGYEPQGFVKIFGLEGRFRPGLDARIATLGRALRP
jgi:neutral ceramidase